MTTVQAAGWLTDEAYGCVRGGTSISYAGRCDLRQLGRTDGLFNYPVKNYGRFPTSARQACCVTALALADAGIDYSEDSRLDIALIGESAEGCLPQNRRYFQDYIDGGRTLSRANLFIYTLPTSPLAEAAVHFGLQGPLLHLCREGGDPAALLEQAGAMLRRAELKFVLIYLLDKNAALCMIAGDGRDALCALDDPALYACRPTDVMALIEMLKTRGIDREN